MTQHEPSRSVRVVPAYQVDTLGAPFRVTLVDSVEIRFDETGKQLTHIPDFVGMIHAAVRCRAAHPRKLNGSDIAFFRKALGIKARNLAEYLDVSPEYLSRCEAGAKVLSSATEKMLRLFVFVASFVKFPDELLEGIREASESQKPSTRRAEDNLADEFLQYFLTLKIQSVFDATDELHFELKRKCTRDEGVSPSCDETEDGKWSSSDVQAA